MKNFFLISSLLLFSCSLFALDAIPSTIQKAVIYPNGATVHRVAKIEIPKGNTTLVIQQLPLDIKESSINIWLPKGVLLLSQNYKQQFVDISKIQLALTKKHQQVEDSIAIVDLQITTLQGQEYILNENRKLSGTEQDAFTVAELRALNAFYGKEMLLIKQELFQLGLQKRQLQTNLAAINAQDNQDGQSAENGEGQLLLEVSSDVAQSVNIDFSYFTDQAGWIPTYDLRVEGGQSNIEISYKASVFQNTGEDWNQIQLSLSNAEPTIDYSLPELTPYYLNFNNYYAAANNNFTFINGVVQGTIYDDNNEPLIGANVIIKGTNIGTSTDVDGKFELNIPTGSKYLAISYTGYNNTEIPITSRQLVARLNDNGMALDEVVVTGYGGRSRGERDYTPKKKQQALPTEITRSQTSFSYNIDLPYSIPSSTNRKSVLIKKEKVAADFEYITMPKITETAFLTAKIDNWQELDLLAGTANIFLDNKYAGQTFLENKPLEDVYILSLGKDDEVFVKRTLQKGYQRQRFIGSNKEETRKWVLEVRNNKSTPITIRVMDQVPISKNSAIKISVEETSNAAQIKAEGLLTWTTTLAARQQWNRLIAYKVKYPKDRRLVVD